MKAGPERIAKGHKPYAIEARKANTDRGLDLGITPASASDIQALAIQRSRGGAVGDGGILFSGGARDGPDNAADRGEARRSGAGEPGGGTRGEGDGGARPGEGVPRPGAGAADELRFSEGTPARWRRADAIRSQQEQSFDPTDALDLPARQGTIRNPRAAVLPCAPGERLQPGFASQARVHEPARRLCAIIRHEPIRWILSRWGGARAFPDGLPSMRSLIERSKGSQSIQR